MASRAESIGAGAGVITGRRAAQRARLHLAAVLEGTTRAYRVAVRNLSCTGAMLEGEELPAAGRMVALKRPGLDLLGTVMWQREGFCGVEFDEPIQQDQVIELARSAPERVEPAPQRVYQVGGVEEHRVSADEWMAIKALAARTFRSFS